MFERCHEHGLPAPLFKEYSGGVSVTFMFAEVIQRIGESLAKQKALVTHLSDRQQKVLNIINQAGELKLLELIERLQYLLPERTLRNDLSALKQLGLVGSRGRGRNAVWFKL